MTKWSYLFVALIFTSFFNVSLAILNVAASDQARQYVNTNETTALFNFSLEPVGVVNITGVYVTFFNGTGNVSAFSVYNDTNSDGLYDSSDVLLGSNTSISNSTNTSLVNFTLPFTITGSSKIIITWTISANAISRVLVNSSIISNTSIIANDTVNNTNFPRNSRGSQTQNVHATVSVTPRFVDTSVINQSMMYYVNITGPDRINGTVLIFPENYTIVNISNITVNGILKTVGCPVGTFDVCAVWSGRQMNFTYNTLPGQYDNITINVLTDTNTSSVASTSIRSFLSGSNLTNVSTLAGDNANISTQPMMTLVRAVPIKNAAYINGTDYWEFNFTFNFTQNATGLMQFRMSNWTDAQNRTINLTSNNTGTDVRLASIRSDTNFSTSNKTDVLNQYNMSTGITSTAVSGSTISFILRMVIPSSTPVSTSWWTTYGILFRSV